MYICPWGIRIRPFSTLVYWVEQSFCLVLDWSSKSRKYIALSRPFYSLEVVWYTLIRNVRCLKINIGKYWPHLRIQSSAHVYRSLLMDVDRHNIFFFLFALLLIHDTWSLFRCLGSLIHVCNFGPFNNAACLRAWQITLFRHWKSRSLV